MLLSSILGRTALHWAVSVDNDVATMILTRNGTKVDAADNKVNISSFSSVKAQRLSMKGDLRS